jgi:hypothetical protein
MFNSVKDGNYYLSVQGSQGHYCSPRETVDPDVYSQMEIAIINKKGKMINANKSSLLKKFERFDELMQRSDGCNGAMVYGYVDVDLINDLYLFLNTNKN